MEWNILRIIIFNWIMNSVVFEWFLKDICIILILVRKKFGFESEI